MTDWTDRVREFASAVLDQPAAAACCYTDAHHLLDGIATDRTRADALARIVERLHGARCYARLAGDRDARNELSVLHRRAVTLLARIPITATATHAALRRLEERDAILTGGPFEHLRDNREPEVA